MLHEYQEAASVSKQQRDTTRISIDFYPRTEDVTATGTETDTATETVTDLLKCDLVFSR